MPTPQKTIYINFFDGIDQTKVNKFIQFTVDAINQHNPTEIYYLISSNGGDVDSGFTLYNFLVSLQGKMTITMHNTGTIDSMANVIFLAGQKRYAAPNASFLYHGIVMNFNAGGYGRTILKEHLSRLDGMEKRMAETISKNSKLTKEELKKFFQQGEGKDVEFALSKDVIHEIKIPSIPQGAIHLAMSFV
ncbi:ATP-dependent Clp protease proteolytic subunit 1 [bacterium BMS3Abin07]|nr:ATP-dependent Clp protease proteolytic subunit 1 [bacterium BMS3Abin07]